MNDYPLDKVTANSAAERQRRFMVLDRKVTQGTKGLIGNLWRERIGSTIVTRADLRVPV